MFGIDNNSNNDTDDIDTFSEGVASPEIVNDDSNVIDPYAIPHNSVSEEAFVHRRTISSPLKFKKEQYQNPYFYLLPSTMSTSDFSTINPFWNPYQNYFYNYACNYHHLNFFPQGNMTDDESFYAACKNQSLRFNPKRLGFIPISSIK